MPRKAAPAYSLVETGQPLSRSLLWELQARYYAAQGAAAWQSNTVPSYITSNPVIARAYARAAWGYWSDLAAEGAIDPAQPLYVVELGAGSGRFAYTFLRCLEEMAAHGGLPGGARPCCVLTDYAAQNVDFWRRHPAFVHFAECGWVDFARFDPLEDAALALRRSGDALGPGSFANPPVFIANYFFDSIPQDVYLMRGGEMKLCAVQLQSTQPEPDPTDPAMLPRLRIDFLPRPCPPAPYDDPELDALLEGYRPLPGPTYITFPVAGLRVLRRLRALSAPAEGSPRFLLLAADMADLRPEDLEHHPAPDLHLHGSFSMRANFHALGAWAQASGGLYLPPTADPGQVAACAFVLGESPTRHPRTRLACAEAFDRPGPDAFFLLKRALEKDYAALDLPALLAFLRAGGCDPRLFLDALPALVDRLPAGRAVNEEAARVAETAAALYYHLGEPRDLPFGAGVVLFRARKPARALACFEQSLVLYGDTAAALYNAALCHLQLGQPIPARARIDAALALEPGFDPALRVAQQLRENGY